MIFYFSATGNSLYVARQIAAEGERLISIPEALDQRIYEYDLEPGENVGSSPLPITGPSRASSRSTWNSCGCLHRCPKSAIQCGGKTRIHGQYQHLA